MNSKKAKNIRKFLRLHGVDPKDVKYNTGIPPTYARGTGFDKNSDPILDPYGHMVIKTSRGVPTVLAVYGRSMYKLFKKISRGPYWILF